LLVFCSALLYANSIETARFFCVRLTTALANSRLDLTVIFAPKRRLTGRDARAPSQEFVFFDAFLKVISGQA